LFQLNRRVFKAYLLKESLERLWDYRYRGAMLNYLNQWMAQLKWQRLVPFEKLAATVILGNLIGRVSTTERRAQRRVRTSSDRAVARASPYCLENLDPAGCAMEQPHVSCGGSAH
jgi:hypothetical protein